MSSKIQDSTWDNQAFNLTTKFSDPNLAEFDYSMWSIVKLLSEEDKDYCIKKFRFSEETVDALIAAQDSDLELLTSGEILSFTVKNDEKEIIKILEEPCANDIILKRIQGSSKPTDYQYWNLAKLFAERAENDEQNLYDVSLQFGLSLDVLKALRQCTGNQIFCLAEKLDTIMGIRFDESLIHRILKVDVKNNINILTMLKYQQTISSAIGLNSGRDMVYSNSNLLTLKQFSDTDNNNRLSKHSLVRTLLARYLLIAGAAVNIVQIETGFTQKNIYRLRGIIQADGLKIINNRSKSQMSSVSIITNINKSIQASLLMALYYFHSESYENIPITQNLNLIPLLRAYRTYHQIMNVTEFSKTDTGKEKISPINFSECWTLARELRSNEACILKSDKFNCYYFCTEHQKVSRHCPYDSPAVAIKSAEPPKKAVSINYLQDEFGDFDVPNLAPDNEFLKHNTNHKYQSH